MNVLVVGANGQLAQALMHLAPSGTTCTPLTRADLDVRDSDAVLRAVTGAEPDLVINGAAYNLVDKAETETDSAFGINAVGPANLARAAREAGAPLVHFSTDYVFDGEQRTPYVETDAPRPLGVYAASKLAGENVTLAASQRHIAIRVCRLFGPTLADGPGSSKKPAGNFPLLMLRLASEREFVRVVDDQMGTPTYTPDLARGVWQLVEKLLPTGQGGLFQITNAGEVSFHEYAREIFRFAGADCRVEPVSSAEYGAASARPLYSTMSNAKAHGVGMVPLRHWRDALHEFLTEHAGVSASHATSDEASR